MGREAPSWTIGALGVLTASTNDGAPMVELRPKERAVLAALAFAHPDPIDASRIAELVWGDDGPATARKSVHNHIARIRAIDSVLIDTSAAGYRLGPCVTIDFSPAEKSPGAHSREPFADLADTPEISARRAHLEARLSAEYEDELTRELHAGPTPSLLGTLHEAVAEQPFSERRWCLLALAQARLDQRREALLTLRLARRQLAEAGLEPGAAIVELETHIHDGAAPLSLQASPHPSPTSHFHPHALEPFVGRHNEQAMLASVWKQTLDGGGVHLAVVNGAAGTGKTRLVDQAVSSFAGSTAPPHVMWGRCSPADTMPHDALISAIVSTCESEPLLGEQLGDQLLPLIALRNATLDAAQIDHGSQVARSLVHAMCEVVRQLAPRPTIWLIDDVQWMSSDSVDLLEAVLAATAEGADSTVLVVATRRPIAPGDSKSGLAPGDLSVPTTQIDLAGLSVAEMTQLIDSWSDGPEPTDNVATDEIARILHERTAGHALYATEIVRRAQLSGRSVDPYDAPPMLTQWVGGRVAELPDDVAAMLRMAAVIGRRVEPTLLARCLDRPLADVAAWCDIAAAAGLLAAGTTVGELEFTHAVTCETVYDLIGPLAAVQLHAKVCAVLERSPEQIDHVALAHHHRHAGPEHRREATQHALLAGQRHFAAGAWDDAARHFGHALDSAMTHETPGNADIADALSWLGRAQAQQGHLDIAAGTLRDALGRARVSGLPLVHARTTLALVGRAGRGAGIDISDTEQLSSIRTSISQLERRRTTTPAHDREAEILMSGLERELAYALLLTDQRDERETLLAASLERVRVLDPPPEHAVANALLATRYAKLSPGAIHERLRDIEEVLAMNPASIGTDVLLAALTYRVEELTRLGEFGAALDAVRDAETVLGQYPHAYWGWAIATWRVVLDIAHGELTSAEHRSFDAFESRKSVDGAAACLAVNLVNIRLCQDRAGEMLDAVSGAIDAHPELPVYRAVRALCSSQSGDADAARRDLNWFSSRGFDEIPHDTNRLLALGVLGHVAADLDDAAAAAELAARLREFDGQWIVISCYGGGGAIWGSAREMLDRLDALSTNRRAESVS